MTTIKHPTLSATREVKASQAAAWLKAGWVRVPADKKSESKSEAEHTPRVEVKTDSKAAKKD